MNRKNNLIYYNYLQDVSRWLIDASIPYIVTTTSQLIKRSENNRILHINDNSSKASEQ